MASPTQRTGMNSGKVEEKVRDGGPGVLRSWGRRASDTPGD